MIRYAKRSFIALAIMATLAATLLAVTGLSPAQAQTPPAPATTGNIEIVNATQVAAGSAAGVNTNHSYLKAGEHIYFSIRLNRAPQQSVVTPALRDSVYFYFQYAVEADANNNAKTPRKANLHGIGQDSRGHYLLFRHTVPAGISSEPGGRLYYSQHAASTVHNELLKACDANGDNCARFRFNHPNNLSVITNRIWIAAGGSWTGSGRMARDMPSNNLSTDITAFNAPGNGVYHRGETIIFRALYSGRLVAQPEGTPRLDDYKLKIHIGPNTADSNHDDYARKASLVRVGNAGDKGYADYQYTVTELDAFDSDGVKITGKELIRHAGTPYLCPEAIGAGCDPGSTANPSGSDGIVEGIRVYPSLLQWRAGAAASLTFTRGNYNEAQVVGGAFNNLTDGALIHYRAEQDLPAGLKAEELRNEQGHQILRVSGTPTSQANLVRNWTVTAYDAWGREAQHTVTINVVQAGAPAFTGTIRDMTVYADNLRASSGGGSNGELALPSVTGGTGQITYGIDQQPGKTLPNWIERVPSGNSQPGVIKVKEDASVAGGDVAYLRFYARDEERRQVHQDFTVSVATRPIPGAVAVSGSVNGFWFRGEKLVFEIPVSNGPVTVDDANLPRLNFEYGYQNPSATYRRIADFAATFGGNRLRFEYTVKAGDPEVHQGSSAGGTPFLRVKGGFTNRESIANAAGHAIKQIPDEADSVNHMTGRNWRSASRPNFTRDFAEVIAWRDADLSALLDHHRSAYTATTYRVSHRGATLPTTTPADAANPPYGITFNPTTRTLGWAGTATPGHNEQKVQLSYQAYVPASYADVTADTVLDSQTVTVTPKQRPVPTRITVTLPTGKTDLYEGDVITVQALYDAPIKPVDGAGKPGFNLVVGDNIRVVNIATVTGNRATGTYTITAEDNAANGVSVPDDYLKNGHLIAGGDQANALKRGNPVRSTIADATTVTVPAHTVGAQRPKISGVTIFRQPQDDQMHETGDAVTGDDIRVRVSFQGGINLTPGAPMPYVRLMTTHGEIRPTLLPDNDDWSPSSIRTTYAVQSDDYDSDGLTLAPGVWLGNWQSLTGANGKAINPFTDHTPAAANVVTLHKGLRWGANLPKPAITIVSNRNYPLHDASIGNALPQANQATSYGSTTAVNHALPSNMGIGHIVRADARRVPFVIGKYDDPDRSDHGRTYADRNLTASDSSTSQNILRFDINIVSDVHLDTANRPKTAAAGQNYWFHAAGEAIKVIVRAHQHVDFADRTQPTMTLAFDNGVSRTATYDASRSNPAAGVHAFKYTVTAGDATAGGPCAVTGMDNAGAIAIEMPASGRIPLAGCYTDLGAPEFAKTGYTAIFDERLGGFYELPPVTKGAGPAAYTFVPAAGATAFNDAATLGTAGNGAPGIWMLSAGQRAGKDASFRYRTGTTVHTVTARDVKGRTATMTLTITTVSVPITTKVTINNRSLKLSHIPYQWQTPTGQDDSGQFYRAGDPIYIEAHYADGETVTHTATGDNRPYIEIDVGGRIRKAYALPADNPLQTAAASHVTMYAYRAQAGDSDADGVTVAGTAIGNCDRLSSPQDAAGNMSKTTNPCPLRGIARTHPGDESFRVRTVRAAGDADLDRDDDGLIDVANANQLALMMMDPDGDGAVSLDWKNQAANYHSSPSSFPDVTGTPDHSNGCPANRCAGYELMNNIDMSGLHPTFADLLLPRKDGLNSWKGKWQTTLEGNGYAIRNLNIDAVAAQAAGQAVDSREVGFINEIGASGTVRNLGFIDPVVKGETAVGIVAGANLGVIERVYVRNGTVTATASTAGLIAGQLGRDASGTRPQRISDFWATGSVNAPQAQSAGSVVGVNYGAIANGWTDAFTDAGLPTGKIFQGNTVIAGSNQDGLNHDGVINAAREVNSAVDTVNEYLQPYLITAEGLASATATAPADYTSQWQAARWNFGDNCQKPVLRLGSHAVTSQNQDTACAE